MLKVKPQANISIARALKVKTSIDEDTLMRIKQKAEGPTMFTLERWVQMDKFSEATVAKLMEAIAQGEVYRHDAAKIEVSRHG